MVFTVRKSSTVLHLFCLLLFFVVVNKISIKLVGLHFSTRKQSTAKQTHHIPRRPFNTSRLFGLRTVPRPSNGFCNINEVCSRKFIIYLFIILPTDWLRTTGHAAADHRHCSTQFDRVICGYVVSASEWHDNTQNCRVMGRTIWTHAPLIHYRQRRPSSSHHPDPYRAPAGAVLL